MRRDLADRLRDRFGIGVMEFYAGTTQKVILANASGEKPGALGRVLPGSEEVAVVRVDLAARKPVADPNGGLERAARGEAGLLVARVEDDDDRGESVVEGAFFKGDRWFVSNDVVREDEDGDYWFVDSLSGFVPTRGGPVSTRAVEDAIYALPEIELAAAVPIDAGDVRRSRSRSSRASRCARRASTTRSNGSSRTRARRSSFSSTRSR